MTRAISDGGKEVVELRVLRKRLQQIVWSELDAEPAQFAFQDVPALGDVLITLLTAEPAPDFSRAEAVVT